MKIHYFQRYHSKENVVTSNTMLMLSRLYNYNSDKFFDMINTIIFMEEDRPEITFDLQVAGDRSVPDAVISQKSFKIVVETKLYNQFNKEQLVKHLSQFRNEEIKVLLTLDPKPMQAELYEEIAFELKKYNSENKNALDTPIRHVNITFEQLLAAMEDTVDDRDTEIVAVLDDFKKYCFDEGVIPDGYKWMRVLTASTTLNDNLELNLYYDEGSKGYSEHGYVGLYSQKCVRAIGKLEKTIIAYYEGEAFIYKNESGTPATEMDLNHIKEAIKRADEYGYDLRTQHHRYFVVEEFYEMDFRKASKNPIQRSKLFNLAEMLNLEKLPETVEIAKLLDGRTWEEF